MSRAYFSSSFSFSYLYSHLDLGPRLQSIAAQHGSLMLLLKHVEYSLSQYELLLHQFAWDFHHIQTVYPPPYLVGFGLGQNVEDIANFSRFLGELNLGPDDQTLSDRLSSAQNAYEHILEYVGPFVPGSSSSGPVISSRGASPGQQVSSSLPQTGALSSTEAGTSSTANVPPFPAVGTSPLAGRGSVVPSVGQPSPDVYSSLVEGQDSGSGVV